MQIVHFTDPACPFAFSAEPQRLQLKWHYGDQLTWRTVLVGLSNDAAELEAKGFDTGKLAAGMAALQQRYGMPIDTGERARLAASMPACRAVVATRFNEPANEEAILRRLCVRNMGGELLDADETIDGAATDVGLDPADLRRWMAQDATERALGEDLKAARSPHPAALVLDHKLADAGDGSGGRRYTCPSYELGRGDASEVAPGMQPWETYDVAVANADPSITRRQPAQDAAEALAWAEMPLATAEVAALVGSDIAAAREQLEQVATFEPVGEDGYWLLRH